MQARGLRDACTNCSSRVLNVLRGWVTNAVVNSAMLKIPKVTPLSTDSLLYRGLNGMAFPAYLLDGKVDVPREVDVHADEVGAFRYD